MVCLKWLPVQNRNAKNKDFKWQVLIIVSQNSYPPTTTTTESVKTKSYLPLLIKSWKSTGGWKDTKNNVHVNTKVTCVIYNNKNPYYQQILTSQVYQNQN